MEKKQERKKGIYRCGKTQVSRPDGIAQLDMGLKSQHTDHHRPISSNDQLIRLNIKIQFIYQKPTLLKYANAIRFCLFF